MYTKVVNKVFVGFTAGAIGAQVSQLFAGCATEFTLKVEIKT